VVVCFSCWRFDMFRRSSFKPCSRRAAMLNMRSINASRWLLICADRAQTTTFKMSHDYLAHMLGNSRPTVSQAAAMLKREG